jgi:hypothetical protein
VGSCARVKIAIRRSSKEHQAVSFMRDWLRRGRVFE